MTLGWQFALLILVLIGVSGVTIKTCVELYDQRQSKQEAEATESVQRQKRVRAILENFQLNFLDNLIRVRLIERKSELTYERLYAWSQEADVIALLEENGLVGIRDELEEFSELYRADEVGSKMP